ncbi:MAG: leucine-rich repeat protein [Ruminiclostridium sp.]|nr:leucine-rich repeat protein [Ruminiclostridium sp.]
MSKNKTMAILLSATLVLGGCIGEQEKPETNVKATEKKTTQNIEERTEITGETTDDNYTEGQDISEEYPNEPKEDTDEYVGEESDDNFIYSIYEKHAEIKEFIGKARRELTIPDEYNKLPVTIIDEFACNNNKSLTKLTIGSNVEKIGGTSFYDNEMLLSVNFKNPEIIKCIGASAFNGCELLSDFPSILPNLETIGNSAFYGTAIKEFTVPSRVEKIEESSFESCKKLKKIIIEDGVTAIGNSVFKNTGLESIIVPDSVTEMGSKIFEGCNDLKEATIGRGLKILGGVFENCNALEKVTLSEGLEDILYNAFYNCSSLKQIEIPKSVKRLSSSDDVGTNIGTFVGCDSLEKVILHEGLEEIGDYAFAGIASTPSFNKIPLSSIVIPNTVNTIGYMAFAGLKNIKEITIPGNVVIISGDAFAECNALEKVIINEGVIQIDYDAFEWCDNLSFVSLPDSLVQIDSRAFSRDENVKVHYKNNVYTYDNLEELYNLING